MRAAGAARRFRRCESGAAILEFALVLPLLLVLVAGTYDVGRMLLVRLVLERAVESGARHLARVQDPGCEPSCSAGARHAIALARDDILRTTRLPADAVRVASRGRAADRTVALSAEAEVAFGLFAPLGLPLRWTVSAAHEERRVVE